MYFTNTQKPLESWALLMIWKVLKLGLLLPFYVFGSSLLGYTCWTGSLLAAVLSGDLPTPLSGLSTPVALVDFIFPETGFLCDCPAVLEPTL